MSLYRKGVYEAAARAFRSFARVSPETGATEDVTLLEAAALAHAGRHDAAALLAEQFLDRYPSSFGADEPAGTRQAQQRTSRRPPSPQLPIVALES
jgi:outer membrane protein assembly factor BamD (BamD/ComL family)